MLDSITNPAKADKPHPRRTSILLEGREILFKTLGVRILILLIAQSNSSPFTPTPDHGFNTRINSQAHLTLLVQGEHLHSSSAKIKPPSSSTNLSLLVLQTRYRLTVHGRRTLARATSERRHIEAQGVLIHTSCEPAFLSDMLNANILGDARTARLSAWSFHWDVVERCSGTDQIHRTELRR